MNRKAPPVVGLYVHNKNKDAIRFYAKNGFIENGTREGDYLRRYVNIGRPSAVWILPEGEDHKLPESTPE